MHLVTHPAHEEHDPRFFLVRGRIAQSAEQPERAHRLRAGALRVGLDEIAAQPHDRTALLAVHSPAYLAFVEDAHMAWRALAEAGPEVVANIHPNRVPGTYPRSIVGRAGWHMADLACPLGPATWKAAVGSADCALTAADLLLAGEREAYALCRPPGHHAYRDQAGGFCFLNNTALAAAALRARGRRVAILDIDVHHGNGTQAIFYADGSVLTVSVHADPADYYPFFWGYAHERGEGAGLDANLNLPLAVGSGDARWLEAVAEGLAACERFACTTLVLALGLDAFEGDPLRGMKVTAEAFEHAGTLVGSLLCPVLVVQEGGYLCPELGDNLAHFLRGFRSARGG